MRVALEAALHGLFLADSADRQQLWISRNDDEPAKQCAPGNVRRAGAVESFFARLTRRWPVRRVAQLGALPSSGRRIPERVCDRTQTIAGRLGGLGFYTAILRARRRRAAVLSAIDRASRNVLSYDLLLCLHGPVPRDGTRCEREKIAKRSLVRSRLLWLRCHIQVPQTLNGFHELAIGSLFPAKPGDVALPFRNGQGSRERLRRRHCRLFRGDRISERPGGRERDGHLQPCACLRCADDQEKAASDLAAMLKMPGLPENIITQARQRRERIRRRLPNEKLNE